MRDKYGAPQAGFTHPELSSGSCRERGYGFRIQTLDTPGWRVQIALTHPGPSRRRRLDRPIPLIVYPTHALLGGVPGRKDRATLAGHCDWSLGAGLEDATMVHRSNRLAIRRVGFQWAWQRAWQWLAVRFLGGTQCWGATKAEVWRGLPGDDLVPAPTLAANRSVTVHAPAAAVWDWLVQLGWHRAGWHRYDGIDPSWSPTRRRAPLLVAGSRRRSTAIRIASSRSSSGYFLGAAMTLILPRNENLHQIRYSTPSGRS